MPDTVTQRIEPKSETAVAAEMTEPRALGTITRHWEETTEHGVFQHRECVGAICECPRCGEDVELLQETEMWQDTGEGVLSARAEADRRSWVYVLMNAASYVDLVFWDHVAPRVRGGDGRSIGGRCVGAVSATKVPCG